MKKTTKKKTSQKLTNAEIRVFLEESQKTWNRAIREARERRRFTPETIAAIETDLIKAGYVVRKGKGFSVSPTGRVVAKILLGLGIGAMLLGCAPLGAAIGILGAGAAGSHQASQEALERQQGGKNCQVQGSRLVCDDGNVCRMVGETMVCDDGTQCRKVGSTVFCQ